MPHEFHSGPGLHTSFAQHAIEGESQSMKVRLPSGFVFVGDSRCSQVRLKRGHIGNLIEYQILPLIVGRPGSQQSIRQVPANRYDICTVGFRGFSP